ncbi:lysM domain receptor-like kinase 3 isoform X2 [Andrographis paniculata]|uniref:lysM domain receptor-like kinase 3 isoform X2 n=1 Tax=Andrographis paniculata TaxID=175694 RepID=UPI0021E84241|nr:lysM domain receptor-like kinase 3 isoform X2 [Andrographis paniculata]
MCRSKMATRASEPARTRSSNPRIARTAHSRSHSSEKPSPSNTPTSPLANPFQSGSTTSAAASTSSYRLGSSVATTSVSSHTSLSSLRDSLPESAQIYDFSEIRAATNNFLGRRHSAASSSSQSWRCVLSGKDVVVFQRKLRKSVMTSEDVKRKMAVISKSHFTSIVKLLGVSISGEHIYLVYEFVQGSDLGVCLRSKINRDFTVLSTWISRMQIATDVAHGLDYIHNNAGLSIDMVHKHVKSSAIIVTEPSFNAKICHFGAAELCGETAAPATATPEKHHFEGVGGYMSPEFKATGVATQKSDVYAFGVVILELMSGQEPLRYKFDRSSGNHNLISIIDTAREAVDGGGDAAAVEGNLRRWIDRRLKDSFPVEVAEKLTRVGLQCVQEDPDKRPDMKWIAGKISKLYLESRRWSDRIRVPTEISASFAPRNAV